MMLLLVNAVICDYRRAVLHAKGCRGLGVTEGKCWFYSLGACTDCHTSIYISDALISVAKGVYEVINCPYVPAALLRRNLRAITFIIH